MARVRLVLMLAALTAALSAALLFPRPVAAQNRICDLSGLLPETVAALIRAPVVLTRYVIVEGHTLQLTFCAPRDQDLVAKDMFDLIERVLPVLEGLTDVRLDGSSIRTIYMDSSQNVYSRGADGYINERDEITLHKGSLESTVVHEVAHYWADLERFPKLWMTEAYAEYLTSLAMAQLGLPFELREPAPVCAGLPLEEWRRAPGIEGCAYTVGPRVFEALAAAAGEENLRQVIGLLSRQQGGVTSMGLLLELEQVSGANLSYIMRDRVFGQSLYGELTERGALRDRLFHTASLAAGLNMTVPPTVAQSLYTRNNASAAAALEQYAALVGAANYANGRCAELGLTCARPWEGLGADPAQWEPLGRQLAGTPQLFDAYAAIQARAAALGLAVPDGLRQAAASLSFDAHIGTLQTGDRVLQAIEAFNQRCAALAMHCSMLWRAQWESGDVAGVEQLLTDYNAAFDAGATLEGRCGDLKTRCRELWLQGLTQGGPRGIGEAVAELNALFDKGAALDGRCNSLTAACAGQWRIVLASGTTADAQAVVAELDSLLTDGAALDASCASAGAPRCAELWRAPLARGNADDARDAITALDQLLADGAALEGRCGDLAAACGQPWRDALGQGSIDAAANAVGDLNRLFSRAGQLASRCENAGWPCDTGWRAAFQAGGVVAAETLLDKQERALPALSSITDLQTQRLWSALPFGGLVDNPAQDPFAEARAAFARGEVALAEELATATQNDEVWRLRMFLVVSVLAVTAVTGVAVILIAATLRRRRAAVRRVSQPASPPTPAPPAPNRSPAAPAPQAPQPKGGANELLADLLGNLPAQGKDER